MSPPVSIAVVSWNTRALLGACLRSLEPDQTAGLVDVWVVDNASDDGSAAMVRDEFPSARLIESDANLGFGPAVNAVARRTKSEWIAPANADLTMFPGAIETLLATGRRDPLAGLVAPRLVLPNGETQHSVHPFPTVGKALAQALAVDRFAPRVAERLCMIGHWDPERGRRVDWAHGAFLLARREAWDQIGGFDDAQWLYAEDLDLAWRMRRAGWATRYEPNARVGHVVSAATEKAFGDERERRKMRAMYAWSVRRRGLIPTWGTAAVNTAATAFRAAFARGGERERLLWHARLHAVGLRDRVRLLDG